MTYEGFAPHKVPVIVECLTDSRNRTAREIRNIFKAGTLGQPGSVAFFFNHLGVVEATHTDLNRDAEADAIAIDRHMTARLLGFEGLAENSYGAIASVDYFTEPAANVAVAMVNLGKFVQDLLLWSTREFGFLRLSDAFVQFSSIMPQKRNPVALEHVRILASRALGEAQAVLLCAHNTPFGDINDSEDPLQPLVFTMFADALRGLRLLAGLLTTAQVDREHLARRAASGFITVTELADSLVRHTGMSFREAHALVARAVEASGADDRPAAIAQVFLSQNPSLGVDQAFIERALDPQNFVRIRRVPGGPAPDVVAESLSRAAASQREIESWIRSKQQLLDAARRDLTAVPSDQSAP